MAWRYYAQRATTGEWLDTNVQLSDEVMSWVVSSPNNGQALLPVGIGNPDASDGRPLFGKFDTILLIEDDDEQLIWFGICTEANPVAKGTALEFIGFAGWLAGVPYGGEYRTWQTKLYNAIRELMTPLRDKDIKPQFNFDIVYYGGETLHIGDPQPPAKPDGEEAAAWQENHGWKQQYELLWWEAPMVGKELDDFVSQFDINYLETVEWTNRAKLEYRVELAIDDGTVQLRRTDIEFVDGVNLAKPIDVKPGNAKFANRVIGLGAGEGRDMLRVDIGGNDGRMYQAEVIQYKAINNNDLLRRMATSDLKFLRAEGVKVETLTVWDMPGNAPISSLYAGQEVLIKSEYTIPTLNEYARVLSITRTPDDMAAVINFEVTR